MKIVLDSSSLISLSETCLIKTIAGLKKEGIEFIIPKSVEFETVTRPMEIKRFELNAERIEKAINEGWINVRELSIEGRDIARRIDFLANNSFYYQGKPIQIMHSGEIQTLALLKSENVDALVIDERTSRMIIENPEKLREVMQRRKGVKIKKNEGNILALQKMFQGISMARSSELIALAFEKGLLKDEIPETAHSLEAALYAVKFAGCAVSSMEIEDFLRGK